MKRSLTALLLTSLCSMLFSQQLFASRPAMEEADVVQEAEELAADTQAEELSAVDIIMQQEKQQQGDVLQLPAEEIQPGEVIKIKLLDSPRRGMSMEKVQNELGQPVSKSDSVGQPPITRWIYPDRVVYFEYSTVLHVVARQ